MRPTAVDRPWASYTFQTGNSCTSYFLSGLFLHKIMPQKARRGKEINQAIFASILFSENEKGQRLHGPVWCAIVHAHCTCHEQRAMSKLNKRAGTGYHLSSDFFDPLQRAEKVFNLRGINQVNSTWKKRTSTRCCNRLDNKNIPYIILRTRVSLNAWKLSSDPYLSQRYM